MTAKRDLTKQVEAFAQELNDLVEGVLKDPTEPFAVVVRQDAKESRVAVRQQPSEGIPICVESRCLLRLQVEFDVRWDSAERYLAIHRSTISVLLEGVTEPLYRYDFSANADGKIPAAHLNVHGHRDEMVHAMVMAARRLRGKSRDVSLDKGKVTRLSSFHFPLGGHRFRPALEDVLEGLVREFGADVRTDWQAVIHKGRSAWRERQLKAAVRDDPGAVAAMMKELGYTVAPPAGGVPPTRETRILAW